MKRIICFFLFISVITACHNGNNDVKQELDDVKQELDVPTQTFLTPYQLFEDAYNDDWSNLTNNGYTIYTFDYKTDIYASKGWHLEVYSEQEIREPQSAMSSVVFMWREADKTPAWISLMVASTAAKDLYLNELESIMSDTGDLDVQLEQIQDGDCPDNDWWRFTFKLTDLGRIRYLPTISVETLSDDWRNEYQFANKYMNHQVKIRGRVGEVSSGGYNKIHVQLAGKNFSFFDIYCDLNDAKYLKPDSDIIIAGTVYDYSWYKNIYLKNTIILHY